MTFFVNRGFTFRTWPLGPCRTARRGVARASTSSFVRYVACASVVVRYLADDCIVVLRPVGGAWARKGNTGTEGEFRCGSGEFGDGRGKLHSESGKGTHSTRRCVGVEALIALFRVLSVQFSTTMQCHCFVTLFGMSCCASRR